MKVRAALILVLVNGLVSVLLLAAYALWIAAHQGPRLATLDVAELYRLKEFQVASALLKEGADEAQRTAALQRAEGFGVELGQLLQSLSRECACLILVQGAVASPSSALPDLTPDVRRKLGL